MSPLYTILAIYLSSVILYLIIGFLYNRTPDSLAENMPLGGAFVPAFNIVCSIVGFLHCMSFYCARLIGRDSKFGEWYYNDK